MKRIFIATALSCTVVMTGFSVAMAADETPATQSKEASEAAAEQEALQTSMIIKLGNANGMALACGKKATASRIKQLMIDKVPKTAVNGDAFERGTQAGFLDVTSKSDDPCSGADGLDEIVDQIERDMPTVFADK